MKLKHMFVPALVCLLMLGHCMAGSAGDFIVEENSDGVVLNVQNTHTVELRRGRYFGFPYFGLVR